VKNRPKEEQGIVKSMVVGNVAKLKAVRSQPSGVENVWVTVVESVAFG